MLNRSLSLRPHWLHFDFLTLHYAYFIGVSLLTGIIFWLSGRENASFVDSLFFTVSAITEAGLNPINLSALNTFQQVILFLLIFSGSAIPVSIVLLFVRKRAYERRFGQFIVRRSLRKSKQPNRRVLVDFSPTVLQRSASSDAVDVNAVVPLVCQEYEAIRLLCWIVPIYFISWQLIGCLGLGAWISVNAPNVANNDGINAWWSGIFLGVSAFGNSGLSLQDMNLIPFRNEACILITVVLLILAGNTCYPIFLRAFLWSLWKALPAWPRFKVTKDTVRFILDHPRDVYTHIFPMRDTLNLLAAVVVLNCVDWIAFEVLNAHNDIVTSLPPVARVLDGLVQAVAMRFGGFYISQLSELNIGLLVLYVLMMYIGAFPVAMTVRSTNVYDVPTSQQLEHLSMENRETALGRMLRGRMPSSLSKHIDRQLGHDLWFLALSVLFVMIIESPQYVRDPTTYSVFSVIFEVVSAYGTVGCSLGLPNHNYAFCGGWHILSKLILACVCLRGRHRGLPDVIDRAVMLPDVEAGHDAGPEAADAGSVEKGPDVGGARTYRVEIAAPVRSQRRRIQTAYT